MSQQPMGQPQQYGQQQQQYGQQQQPGGMQGTTGVGQPQGTTQVQPQVGDGRNQSLLYRTKNYLPQDVRVEVIRILNGVLADTTILMTQAKFAHWNVKGQDFYGLHELFDDIAEVFEVQADDIAERITALGGQALGTAGSAVANRQVPPMQHDAVMGMEYVQVLANNLAVHDANLHEAIQAAQQYDDVDTIDLLNEVSREVSKYLWFLEAHLQTQPVSAVSVSGGIRGTQGRVGAGRGVGTQAPGIQQPSTGQQGQVAQQPPTGQQGQVGQVGQQPPMGQ